MNSGALRQIVKALLSEIQEEEVTIHLLNGHYRDEDELIYFVSEDRERILKIMDKLISDSTRHKQILEQIVALLNEVVSKP